MVFYPSAKELADSTDFTDFAGRIFRSHRLEEAGDRRRKLLALPSWGIILVVTGKPDLDRRKEGSATPVVRIGIGHDTHRLRQGGPLRLGGINIPHDREMVGHSDADALLHAVADALLGAAALGDIGEFFPDTDSANKGRDSAEMLREAWDAVSSRGWRIANLDCIVFAQRPKIGPVKQAMRERVAAILDLKPDQVGIKAKTGETVGPIGREEAIAAECVVLLERD